MLRFRRTLLPALCVAGAFLATMGCEPDPEECWEQTGSLAQVTTDTVTVNHLSPAISPDGTRVLFTTDAFIKDIDRDEGDPHDFVLVDLPVPGEVRTPSAFVLDVGNARRVMISALADEASTIEDPFTRHQAFPAWHPDGNRFAGTVTNPNQLSRLYIFTLDWASATSLEVPTSDFLFVDDVDLAADPNLRQYFYEYPTFTPDGAWLLYARHFYRREDQNFPEISHPQAIYAINVADLQAGTVTIVQVAPEGSMVTHPTVSPSADRIAFEANYSGQREIYSIAFDPSSPTPRSATMRQLTRTTRDDGDPIPVHSIQPTWLRTGQIAFTSTRRSPCTSQRQRDIWVMNGDGSDQRLAFRSREDDHFPAFDPSGGNTIVFSTKSNPIEEFEGSKTDLWILRGF